MKIIIMIITAIIILTGCSKQDTITINKTRIIVEVVQTDIAKYRGLMFRESLGENSGMLFVYSNDRIRGIWMKNMNFPLDLVYINSKNIITDIIPNVPSCTEEPCKIYNSENPVRYVLEVNAGFAQRNNIITGQMVKGLDKYK